MTSITKFDLLANAKDSLAHAVEHLTVANEPTPGDLKRAIQDVAHVVQLMLKERLRRVHPAFIWDNVDKYPSNSAFTISTDKAVNRLLRFGQVNLMEDEKKTIAKCRLIRNSIEHFEFEIEKKEAMGLIGRILSFIFTFAKKQLDVDWESDFRKDKRWSKLVEIHEFWLAHSFAIHDRLEEEGAVVCSCPNCNAGTFDRDADTCMLCGHSEEHHRCSYCRKTFWESELEKTDIMEGDYESGGAVTEGWICQDCIDDAADAYMEYDIPSEPEPL